MKAKIDVFLEDIFKYKSVDDETGTRIDFDWRSLEYLLRIVRENMRQVPLREDGMLLVNASAVLHALVAQKARMSTKVNG